MTNNRTLFIYTETLLHAGMGTGLGAVDLPIQREKTTGLPIIQGSGIKGALRQQYKGSKEDKAVVFGPDDEPDYAGAVSIGDARVLAFPVRALKGVFVWVTSHSVLARFARDCGIDEPLPPRPPAITDEGFSEAYISDTSLWLDEQGRIVLEEYLYTGKVSEQASNWACWLTRNALPQTGIYKDYYHDALKKRFVILPDNDFRDFTLYSTEVRTRIKIDREKKTVDDGALFTEEALPADTLLYVPVSASKPRMPDERLSKTSFDKNSTDIDVLDWLTKPENTPTRVQIGGDETVGYGFSVLNWGDK
jgi:CRISPR-associated protein Cmr4